MPWYVYILRCGDGTLYTGITDDIPRRLAAHRAGMLPVMVPDLLEPGPELEKILYSRVERLDQVIILMEGMKDS